LTAGLGYLSIGSDLAGSIRIPANFCGIFGHRPTLNLVSTRGHLPGGAHANPGGDSYLGVVGPMARSARDLLASLKTLGGPTDYTAKAWRWTLPAPRPNRLRDFRVGYVIDDLIAPPTPEIKAVLEKQS
jgi:amidase